MISKETTSSSEDGCTTLMQMAAQLGVEVVPERQERLSKECDLIRAGFLARTEMCRYLDARNTTENIAINSAMAEVLTAVYLGGCGAQGEAASVGLVVVPQELGATSVVLEKLLARAPSTTTTQVFGSGAEQLEAGALAASPAGEQQSPTQVVVVLQGHDAGEAFTAAAKNAAQKGLSTLTCVINVGNASELERAAVSLAWRDFGWHVSEVRDGHSFGSLMAGFDPQDGAHKPRAVIVSTCYGKALPLEGTSPSANIELPLDALKVIIEERTGIQELAGESIKRSVERLVTRLA